MSSQQNTVASQYHQLHQLQTTNCVISTSHLSPTNVISIPNMSSQYNQLFPHNDKLSHLNNKLSHLNTTKSINSINAIPPTASSRYHRQKSSQYTNSTIPIPHSLSLENHQVCHLNLMNRVVYIPPPPSSTYHHLHHLHITNCVMYKTLNITNCIVKTSRTRQYQSIVTSRRDNHTHMHTYAHTHKCTHAHAHTHTHTHTCLSDMPVYQHSRTF